MNDGGQSHPSVRDTSEFQLPAMGTTAVKAEEDNSATVWGGGLSPLGLMSRDARTQELLAKINAQLQGLKRSDAGHGPPPTLTLSASEVAYARDQWEQAILRGEHRLYELATLMAHHLLGTTRVEMVARLIAGQDVKEEEAARITIEETISRDNLRKVTDHTLASRIARRYQYRSGHEAPFGKLYPRASFLEFRPLEAADGALATRISTRVKIVDQIWNKVCDALFEVDKLMKRDKILLKGSKYVKDVFGIKLLTARNEDSYLVEEALATMCLESSQLALAGLEPSVDNRSLTLLERKDYLSLPRGKKKRTGWEAIKNVYRWGGQVFEVQIQTEANYFLETLHLSMTSHQTFEMQRRDVRRQLEAKVPHYRDFRMLLKAIFKGSEGFVDASTPDWIKVTGD